jgi:hypothetical protein
VQDAAATDGSANIRALTTEIRSKPRADTPVGHARRPEPDPIINPDLRFSFFQMTPKASPQHSSAKPTRFLSSSAGARTNV